MVEIMVFQKQLNKIYLVGEINILLNSFHLICTTLVTINFIHLCILNAHHVGFFEPMPIWCPGLYERLCTSVLIQVPTLQHASSVLY